MIRSASLPLSYRRADGWVRTGRVTGCSPHSLVLRMRGVSPGAVVRIEAAGTPAYAEVRRVEGAQAHCALLTPMPQVVVGAAAVSDGAVLGAYCGAAMLGRCVDAWGGAPGCGAGAVREASMAPLPLEERRPITVPLHTGVPAIDGLCMLGTGQRVALFAGAGVGKSTLLRQLAARARVDAHVVALIGERGREAAETVAALRNGAAWPRTTVVCATAESGARERFAAARTAVAQAEWLCESGLDVLLTVDSLTRVATAWREMALMAGEAPVHRGYPASMIGALAGIVERAGARRTGSITGIYAVLVDGDDPFEPVTDAVRALLDGHIVLSRSLAESGRFPPIAVLRSLSRVMSDLAPSDQLADAALVRKALATLENAGDLFALGAYKPGGDPWLDAAVAQRERLEDFVHSGDDEVLDAAAQLRSIAMELRAST